jgi:hypothetical protein
MQNEQKRITMSVIFYPTIYIVLTFPLAISRNLDRDLNPVWYYVGQSLYACEGWCNVFLYTTRDSLDMDGMAERSSCVNGCLPPGFRIRRCLDSFASFSRSFMVKDHGSYGVHYSLSANSVFCSLFATTASAFPFPRSLFFIPQIFYAIIASVCPCRNATLIHDLLSQPEISVDARREAERVGKIRRIAREMHNCLALTLIEITSV